MVPRNTVTVPATTPGFLTSGRRGQASIPPKTTLSPVVMVAEVDTVGLA